MKALPSTLRSVELGMPDLDTAEKFFAEPWNLAVVARAAGAVYLRGTGAAHHIVALHAADSAAIRSVTFSVASRDDLDAIARNVPRHGGALVGGIGAVAEPGGGTGLTVRDPQGRVLRFVCDGAVHADAAPVKDRPERLAHVVLNSRDVAAVQPFYEQALGFRLSDRTRIMAFMRINSDHHSIAMADADNDCLNHVAFLMPDLDSVMRGGGRMIDAGYPIEWGVGRHGPGNNAFAYFIGPAGLPIEYTAEVQQVDDTYRTGGPDDWKWPPGRVDQWGVSPPPSKKLKDAQRLIGFAAAGAP